MVTIPLPNKIQENIRGKKSKYNKIKITPAATKVDEWTNEEIGVGAAIAAGNQEEKGNWALLVNAKNKSRIIALSFQLKLEKNWEDQFSTTLNPNKINKNKSPTRLERIVSCPLFWDFQFK